MLPCVAGAVAASAGLAALGACTTVDPGPNYVVPQETFDADYFYCHVEPELIFGKKCGDGNGESCHYSPSAVSGMAIVRHDPIDCGGGDHPVSRGAIGAGSPAQGNLEAVSIEMSRDYLSAPLYVRPLGANHPRQIFAAGDPVVDVIRTWASK